MQSLLDITVDEEACANDMLIEIDAIDGGDSIKLVRGPVPSNHEPVETTRSPVAFEDTEAILLEMGMEWAQIERMKAAGAIS